MCFSFFLKKYFYSKPLNKCVFIYKELAASSGEFAQTVSDLSSADVGKQLSQSLAGLADVERKAQDLQSVQSEQDMTTLMATGIYSFFLFFSNWLVFDQ